MKKFLKIGCFAILLIFVLGTVAFAADLTFKLGHIADPKNPYARGGQKFADLVKEKSGGSIEIQVFPSSQLGNQRDIMEGLMLGTVDFSLNSTAVVSNFLPQIGVFDLPFIIRDRAHAFKALDTVGMEIGKNLEPMGVKMLAYLENGIRNMTNNVRPISKPEDLKGLKMRVVESPVFVAMMEALEANPTPMAFSELFTALQKGVVDGQENPAAHIYTKRFFEVQKYISFTEHIYAAEPLLISMSAWNKLNDSQKKIVQESANEARDWQRQLSIDLENGYWDKIRETGKSEIIEDVDREAFKAKTRSVWDKFEEKIGKETIEAVVQVQ